MKINLYLLLIAGMIFSGIAGILFCYGCGPRYVLVSSNTTVQRTYAEGVRHYRLKEYKRAMEKFIIVLQHEPEHTVVREYLEKSKDGLKEKIRKQYEDKVRKVSIKVGEEMRLKRLRSELEEAYDNKNWMKVERKAKEILSIKPRDEEAELYLKDVRQEWKKQDVKGNVGKKLSEAQSLKRKGAIEESYEIVKDILSHFPAHLEALELDKELTFVLKEKEARLKLRKFFEKKEVELNYQKALKFVESTDYIESVLHFEDVLKLNPDYKQATGKLKEARRKVKEQTRIAVEDSLLYRAIAPEYKKAVRNYLRRDYKKALTYFKKIADLVRFELALRYQQRLNERLEREEKFKKAKFLYESAVKYHREGNFFRARVSLNEAFILSPDYYEASYLLDEVKNILDTEKRINNYISRAESNYKKRDYAGVLAEAEKVYDIDADNKLANDIIKKVAVKLAKTKKVDLSQYEIFSKSALDFYENENYSKAIEKWAKLLLINPSDREAISRITYSMKVIAGIRRAEELKLRRKRQREAARIKRQQIHKNLDRASKLSSEGKHKQAIEIWGHVLRSAPSNIEALQGIEKSKRTLEEDIPKGVSKEKIDTYYRDGLIFFSEGKYTEAIRKWMRVLKFAPKHEKARANIKIAREKLELHKR